MAITLSEAYTDLQAYVKVHRLAATATITSNFTTSSTTCAVDSTAGFAASGYFLVDEWEIVRYTGKTATSFTGCTRGFYGLATTHYTGEGILAVDLESGTSPAIGDLFDDAAVEGDIVCFGIEPSEGQNKFGRIKITVATPLAAAAITLGWYYWSSDQPAPWQYVNNRPIAGQGYPQWKALTVTDGTNSFQNPGQNTVTFAPPGDWFAGYSGTMVWNGIWPAPRYVWVMCKIESVAGLTEGGAASNVQLDDNKVILTGYSSVTPADWEDIYQADVAGGWGLVSRTGFGFYHYVCLAGLQIGDGGSGAYFMQLEEMAEFGAECGWQIKSDAAVYLYYHPQTSYAQYKSHPLIMFHGSTPYAVLRIEDGAEVKTNNLILLHHHDEFNQFAPNLGEIQLQGGFHIVSPANRWNPQGCGILTSSPGATIDDFTVGALRGMAMSGTLSNFTVETEMSYDGVVSAQAAEQILTNAKLLEQPAKICFVGSTGHAYLRNVVGLENATALDPTRYRFFRNIPPGPQCTIQWQFDLSVIDEDGDAVEGATVTITDADGAEVYSGTTDINGEIPTQWLTRWYAYNFTDVGWCAPEAIEAKTPHTVAISKAGYKTRTMSYDMDRVRAEIEMLEAYAAPVADFVAGPASGEQSLAVQFADLSTGEVASWEWDFGDGDTSTDQNPTHTYSPEGTYTVALTVTGPGGSDTETKTGYITVTSPVGTVTIAGVVTDEEVAGSVETDEITGAVETDEIAGTVEVDEVTGAAVLIDEIEGEAD